jgi:AmiR/NasT family two-component response regulator
MDVPPAPLKIVLAHGLEDARTLLYQTLQKLRYDQIRACHTGRDLVSLVKADPPDLIITGVDLPDQDGIAALLEISETIKIPAIVVTQQRTLDVVERALEDHVMAYLLEPVNVEEIMPTIYLVLRRFEQFQELERENESLKQALADRKVIERAKGSLMKFGQYDEEVAYKRLRRYATDNRMKLAEAADRVLNVFTLLDSPAPDVAVETQPVAKPNE